MAKTDRSTFLALSRLPEYTASGKEKKNMSSQRFLQATIVSSRSMAVARPAALPAAESKTNKLGFIKPSYVKHSFLRTHDRLATLFCFITSPKTQLLRPYKINFMLINALGLAMFAIQTSMEAGRAAPAAHTLPCTCILGRRSCRRPSTSYSRRLAAVRVAVPLCTAVAFVASCRRVIFD